VRVRLVDLLEREGEMAVGALAEALGESCTTCRSILRSCARLLVTRRHRGREVWYRLSSPPAALCIYDRVAVALREAVVEHLDQLRRAGQPTDPASDSADR